MEMLFKCRRSLRLNWAQAEWGNVSQCYQISVRFLQTAALFSNKWIFYERWKRRLGHENVQKRGDRIVKETIGILLIARHFLLFVNLHPFFLSALVANILWKKSKNAQHCAIARPSHSSRPSNCLCRYYHRIVRYNRATVGGRVCVVFVYRK